MKWKIRNKRKKNKKLKNWTGQIAWPCRPMWLGQYPARPDNLSLTHLLLKKSLFLSPDNLSLLVLLSRLAPSHGKSPRFPSQARDAPPPTGPFRSMPATSTAATRLHGLATVFSVDPPTTTVPSISCADGATSPRSALYRPLPAIDGGLSRCVLPVKFRLSSTS
jgi:hypothetical protein